MQAVELHSIEPESKNVKTLYEIFSWGREALGEYLYHAEIDSKGVKEDGTGDLNKAEYNASVEVSFETDVLDVAKNIITQSRRLQTMPSIDVIGKINPSELFQNNLGAEEFFINGGSNHCFILRAVSCSKTVVFVRYSVEDGRTTEIQVTGKGTEIKLSELYDTAIKLIEKYKQIPVNKFSGAIRE